MEIERKMLMKIENDQLNEQETKAKKIWLADSYKWLGVALIVVTAVILIGTLFSKQPAATETQPYTGVEFTAENQTEITEEEGDEASTGVATEESTEAATVGPTEESTEAMTGEPTEESTEAMTEEPTGESAEAMTEEPTEVPTEKPTEAPTEESTEEETMYLPARKSNIDFNGNGVDDYTDFVLGARQDAINHPTYDGSWWATGYPPDDIGVCSDVIWRAFKYAGYCLKDMVDADILARRDAYPLIERPEPPIDFRRVRNLRIFFEEYAVKLKLDIHAVEEWQPGDIVIFGNDKHIGIVSDIRDKNGIPYIIHNGGQDDREENYLVQEDSQTVTGHYRFDASLLPENVLIPWTE